MNQNEKLRAARLSKRWTQQDVAEQLDITIATINRWENGKTAPSLSFRKKLTEIFEMTEEQLGFSTTDLIGVSGDHLKNPDPNHRRMLRLMRSTWIDGVLQHSLHHAAMIALGLQEQPEALANPWHLEVQETNWPPRTLSHGTTLLQVYDSADGKLLLLGEPGAGKTTLLLELARELLNRAEPESYPLPVILILSSWAVKQLPFTEWLLQELSTKYHMPRSVGQEWLDTNRFVLLLDGLDEVVEEVRATCVKAINVYLLEHELASMVVCCRTADYFSQATRITLQQAVSVQPLTTQQIELYLFNARQLEGVRKALKEDEVLQEIARTPLMLDILTLTYQGEAHISLTTSSLESRREQLFAIYIRRMLERRRRNSRYTETQTIRWLSWLARQMVDRKQTEFYLERMQPDLLSDRFRQRHRNVMIRLIYSVESFVVGSVFAWIFGGKPEPGMVKGVGNGLLGWLGSGPGNRILGWMAPGLGGGLEGGGMFGLILGMIFIIVTLLIDASDVSFERWVLTAPRLFRSCATGLRNGLVSGGMMGCFCFLLFSSFFASRYDLSFALSQALGFGVFTGQLVGLVSILVLELRSSSKKVLPAPEEVRTRLIDGGVIGLCGGGGFGMVSSLLVGVSQGVTYGTIVGLAFAAAFSFGGGTQLIRGVGKEIKTAETIGWNWRNIKQNQMSILTNGLSVGLIILTVVTLIIGSTSSLLLGSLSYGWKYGLVYGAIVGLIAGIASILTGVLNSGWTNDTLEERQILRPNEGIRRSLLNSFFAGSLFGMLGGIASGAIVGLAFGLIGGLAGWPVLGAGFAIILGSIFALEFAMIRGGIAFIEHFVLRWHLWQSKCLPWRYAQFLDYAAGRILLLKVGGGYIFIHRLLLEYFAALHKDEDLSF